ncbi:DUF6415 family natural product biosynthesis protein [Streptomyces acidiscabies]|uniref:DUF6415 family natural product biosynthesis protein n=1 Tax=Streptomyces acidiscabies TaxID=42234 RepID=A0ABU4MBK8_9ACTN|nr:DUF6415 family natural product biosynthesis protein [Streptomyces acidiscabies]MDX3024083.1 DUF6415 family natural product biosynthesis protein [Streptomyces acidiscabies]
MQVYEVDPYGTVTRSGGTDSQVSLGTICAAATWYCEQETLLRHGEVAEFGQEFTAFLNRLVPEVERLIKDLDPGDADTETAFSAVWTARERMGRPEADGLKGESERVRNLALSVTSLAYHHKTLSGSAPANVSSTR